MKRWPYWVLILAFSFSVRGELREKVSGAKPEELESVYAYIASLPANKNFEFAVLLKTLRAAISGQTEQARNISLRTAIRLAGEADKIMAVFPHYKATDPRRLLPITLMDEIEMKVRLLPGGGSDDLQSYVKKARSALDAKDRDKFTPALSILLIQLTQEEQEQKLARVGRPHAPAQLIPSPSGHSPVYIDGNISRGATRYADRPQRKTP